MGAGQVPHDFGISLRSFVVKRDHLAARIALRNCHDALLTDSECAANQVVFAKTNSGFEIEIHVGTKAALVYIKA